MWQIEISKLDLVWRQFWNSEIRKFLTKQPVFLKCLMSTRCKTTSVSIYFCSFFVLILLNLLDSEAIKIENWLWCQKFLLFRIPETPLNQILLAYFYLSDSNYFSHFNMRYPVVRMQMKTEAWFHLNCVLAQACRPWGCRGCHGTPIFWQIS